ncbi:uncharacterized protein [Amphiura filiformis]|uniref:uncharacterized protein n=1 Tax=Amphiura filiformis TaxID=82378 RepID=UPI003B20B68E
MADSDDENVLYAPTGKDIHRQGKGLLGNGVKNVNDILNGPSDNRRLKKTIALCAAFLGLGLALAVVGPTLKELQHHLGVDFPRVSYVFTGRSIGYVIGSIIGGMTFESFHPLMMIALTLGMSGIGLLVTPYCHQLMASVLAISFVGVAMGALDTGANVVCLRMWGKKSAPFMQALHFSFALGAFIAPLLAGPFIGPVMPISDASSETTLSPSSPVISPASVPSSSLIPSVPKTTVQLTTALEPLLTNATDGSGDSEITKSKSSDSDPPIPPKDQLKAKLHNGRSKPNKGSSKRHNNQRKKRNALFDDAMIYGEMTDWIQKQMKDWKSRQLLSQPEEEAKQPQFHAEDDVDALRSKRKKRHWRSRIMLQVQESSTAEPKSTAPQEKSAGASKSTAPPEDSAGKPKSTAIPEESAGKPKSTAPPEESAGKAKSTAPPEDSAGKPKSTAIPEESAGKPKSTAQPEESAGKAKSTAPPEDSAGKPKSMAPPEESAGKPKSMAPPEESAGKPKSMAPPEESVVKPTSTAPPEESADKAISKAPPEESAEKAKSTAPPEESAEKPKSTALPEESAEKAKSTAPPEESAEKPKSTAPPEESAGKLKSTAPPEESAEKPKSTTPPKESAEKAKSMALPEESAEKSISTAPPEESAEKPKSTAPPEESAEKPKSTAPPEESAEKPKSTTPPEESAEKPKSTAPPEESAEKPKSTAPPEESAEKPKSTAPPEESAEKPKSTAPPEESVEKAKSTAPPEESVEKAKSTAPPEESAVKPKSAAPPEKPAGATKPEAPTTAENFQGVYVIIAVYLMFMALVFGYFFCTSPAQFKSASNGHIDSEANLKPSEKNFTHYILGLLFLFYFLYVGGEVGYGGFIYSFATDPKTEVNFTSNSAAQLNALFWGTFALGRGVSICIASILSPLNMVLLDLVGCIISSMALAYEANTNEVVLWVGTATLGVSMASLFPSGISWLESHAPVTGNVASFLIIGAAFGEMAIPLLLGHLFGSGIGPMSLMYTMLAITISTAAIFGGTVYLAASEGRSYDPLPTEDVLEGLISEVKCAIDDEDELSRSKQASKPFLPKPLQKKKHKE